jgi:hypothetical protein
VTRLRETIPIERPAKKAQEALERFFAPLNGRAGPLRLRVPFNGATGDYGIYFDRDVLVEANRARDEGNLNDVVSIKWTPEGTGIFPRFSGRLVVCGDDDPSRSYIELDGFYAPPLGAAGQVFDAAIGHHIARATARELLADIKTAIECPA